MRNRIIRFSTSEKVIKVGSSSTQKIKFHKRAISSSKTEERNVQFRRIHREIELMFIRLQVKPVERRMR